jgi:hypothetical protein
MGLLHAPAGAFLVTHIGRIEADLDLQNGQSASPRRPRNFGQIICLDAPETKCQPAAVLKAIYCNHELVLNTTLTPI